MAILKERFFLLEVQLELLWDITHLPFISKQGSKYVQNKLILKLIIKANCEFIFYILYISGYNVTCTCIIRCTILCFSSCSDLFK